MGNLFCFVLICVGGAVVLLNNLCPFHQEKGGGGRKVGQDLIYCIISSFLLGKHKLQCCYINIFPKKYV